MDILELLMKNWWLLLAVLWFFSGALGKKGKKQQGEQQREQQYTPQSAETPSDESELMGRQASIEFPWEKVGQESQRETITRQSPREFLGNSTRQAENNNQLVRTEIGEETGRRTTVKSPSEGSYSKHAKNLLDFKSIDKTKVVQGIIWSQILGKPRSKEPHRATMYSRGKR